ncbi:hypothetical protein BST95_14500 [Halioglobus japonicus]|uniref:Uncharacterized protein n=1 Tax=Halioglobus japonicus TaxID=930805 RepID=A0AAP8MH15_9GAMM|nr:hypothetical protein [Halioglobus japonicus]AQA19274.1 hypothetical protein BST95_14500 [Halioglobus japonicus]PLW87688.1 hypothetical protein C0029_03685 [Halioglobus japonicus]GHD07098.1 hypothetical protein GCM10007052_02560 [Halioglobus japonicus]
MKVKAIVLITAVASLNACKIEIETPVEGGVTTSSNNIECPANQACTVDVSDLFFNETFVADPAPGWQFARWNKRHMGLCGGNSTPCTINTAGFEGNEDLEAALADPTSITYLKPEFVVPRTTSGIALADQATTSRAGMNFDMDFYRNSAYGCGLSGNYTFMVFNPGNGSADDEAPLWVYLHGGGVGHFDDQGNYYAVNNQTASTWNEEETFLDLQRTLEVRIIEDGQVINNTLTRRIQEGYRLLVVSMCDHDLYSGLGTPYTDNPNSGAEVNGMQATMSAVDYVVANYPTTQVWAHGTSAGSSGTYNLAMSFVAEGIHFTGAVPDSLFPTPRAIPLTAAYGGDPKSPYQQGFDPEAAAEKIGFYGDLSRGAYPEARIGAGFTDVPFLFTGGRNDPFCNHNLPVIPEAIAEGIDHNCDYYHEGISQAIAGQPNSPHQLAYIQDRGHVPTLDAGPVNNTVDAFMGDILADNPGAPFRKIPGLNMMLMGHSFFRPFAAEMPYHAVRAGVDGHSQQLEISGGASGAPLALWNDTGHRNRIQAVLDAGDVELFGMTCCDTEEGPGEERTLITEGYKRWFDYALAQNPDTDFFIALPWRDFPTDYADAEAYADPWYEYYDDIWLAEIDELRSLYPGVTIYSIPYGAAANELRRMFEAGELPDVSSLQGPATSAIFTDYKGHAGQILKDLGELIWINAIYGVDLDRYAYDPLYQTDLKAIAKSIMDAHNPDYNGPNR